MAKLRARQALNPSSHVCLSPSATDTHFFSHAPPLLQQLGTPGALLGKAHLGQSAVELLARSAPAAGSTGAAAGASFALLASLLAWLG